MSKIEQLDAVTAPKPKPPKKTPLHVVRNHRPKERPKQRPPGTPPRPLPERESYTSEQIAEFLAAPRIVVYSLLGNWFRFTRSVDKWEAEYAVGGTWEQDHQMRLAGLLAILRDARTIEAVRLDSP